MTVGELKRMIDKFDDERRVIFTPREYCGEGYPEFLSADVADSRSEHYLVSDPLNAVVIKLKDESE